MTFRDRLLYRLAPPGSSRQQLPLLIQEAIRVWHREGLQAVAIRTYWTVRSHWRGLMIGMGMGVRPYDYERWIADNEPDESEIRRQREKVGLFPYRPLISIITPVYNPPAGVFEETLGSVINQTYDNWELCLVDGGSDKLEIAEIIGKYAQKDGRIRSIRLEENLGISGNSNVGLATLLGEYVALLDHDDLLAPNMLYEVVSCLNHQSDSLTTPGAIQSLDDDVAVDILYFDEDKISADSKSRRSPWFKPKFAPDTLLANNILMHCVIRRALLQDIGGFDSNMDGTQDWDVALRCSEQTDRIVHIPKVLYHWRQIEGSAALDANAKPWAYEAQARCIAAHLTRIGVKDAKVTFPQLGQVRINWPTQSTLVSIVILTKNKTELIRACIDSILGKSTYQHYEIILVDTGSTEQETLEYYKTLNDEKRIHIVNYESRFNFSAANNFGATYAQGNLLLFLNNDTEVLEPTWLEEMVGWAIRPETAIVGVKLVRPDHTIQHGGIIMGMMGHGAHVYDGGREQTYGIYGSTEWFRNFQAVTGACMMVKRSVFQELGGFDETYEIAFNDIDLCLRAVHHGYRVVYTPFARVLHHEGSSRGFYIPPGDLVRATLQMWQTIKAGDPNYNVNLSYLNRLPAFAHPKDEKRDQRLLFILQQFGLAPWAASMETDQPDLFHDACGPLPIPPYWNSSLPTPTTMNNRGNNPRVLLVSHDLSLSGAPLMLFILARYLQKNNFEVSVVSALDGGLSNMYSEANIKLTVVPDLLGDIRVGARVVAGFDEGPFDLVIANTIITWQIIHVARAYHIPSILWIHESEYGRNLAREHRLYADTIAYASKVVFPTQTTADLYREFTNQNSIVFPYGLDKTFLSNYPQGTIKNPSGTLTIANIGSIESRKGQDFLLRAIQILPASVQQQTHFIFAGRVMEQAFWKTLQRMGKKLDNVEFIGEVNHEEAMNVLSRADIFVLASKDEVLPVTILEAMYYGKPIISTKVGGVAEVLSHKENGYLVPYGDHSALANGISALVNDTELRAQIGQRARVTYEERLTNEKMGTSFLEVINQLLNLL